MTTPESRDALAQLLALFDLQPSQPDGYIGQSLDLGFRNLFGGHILGQSLMAAGLTCGERRAHSLHAYFLRGGDAQQPVHYQVDRIRDGGSFSVRRVTASQDGKPILILSTSFQVDEPGFEHQLAMPDVPPPDVLAPFAEISRPRADAVSSGRQITSARAIEIRPVPRAKSDDRAQYMWMRAAGTMPDGAALHRSLLAYASDFALLSTAMLPHGVGYYTPGIVMASLDHAMWFYGDLRVDDWLLYAMDSPAAAGARGLARGNIFRRDGKLVACVAQEGLMRMPSRD